MYINKLLKCFGNIKREAVVSAEFKRVITKKEYTVKTISEKINSNLFGN